MVCVIMNGKLGGSGVHMAPVALLNDGLLDVTLQHGPPTNYEFSKFIRYCLKGAGSHIYLDNYAYFRGKSIKIVNRNESVRPRQATDQEYGIEEA